MTLDIAMGGSTNTVLHILAIAHEAGVDFTMADIDRLSRKVPEHLQGGAVVALPRRGRAPRRRHLHHPGRARPRRPHPPRGRHRARADDGRGDRRATISAARPPPPRRKARALAAPGGVPTQVAFSQDKYFADADDDVDEGLHPRRRARLQQGRRPRGALRQHRDGRLHREDRRRRRVDLEVRGPGARLPLAGRGLRRHHGRPDRRRATSS